MESTRAYESSGSSRGWRASVRGIPPTNPQAGDGFVMISVHKNGKNHRVKTPHVNVDDVWFSCKTVYVKAEGMWRKVYNRSADIIQFPATRRYKGDLHDVRISAARR